MEYQRPMLIPRKYKLSDKWKTPWCIHKNVLHINYFISCHRKKMQHTIRGLGVPCILIGCFFYLFSLCLQHIPQKQMTVFSFLLPRFLAVVLVFLCMCQRTLSGQALEEKRMAMVTVFPGFHLIPNWHYPTDTSLPPLEEVCCTSPLETNPKISCPCPSIPHAGIQLCL